MDAHTEWLKSEYEGVSARINENEKRRYQTFMICITGFAAVIGFGEQQSALGLIPIGLASVFMLCAREYSIQSVLQRVNTAYLIERLEAEVEVLRYASMDAAVSYGKRGWRHGATAVLAFVFSPLHILAALGIGGTLLYYPRASHITWYLLCVIAMHALGLTFSFYNHFRGLERTRSEVRAYLSGPK